MSKKQKKNWLKRQLNKVQLLPWYWKGVTSVVVFFLGGTLGTQMFTAADDVTMFLGVVLLVACLWFILQMWVPKK